MHRRAAVGYVAFGASAARVDRQARGLGVSELREARKSEQADLTGYLAKVVAASDDLGDRTNK